MCSECRDRGVACRSRRRLVLRGARNRVSGVKPPPRVPEARDAYFSLAFLRPGERYIQQ